MTPNYRRRELINDVRVKIVATCFLILTYMIKTFLKDNWAIILQVLQLTPPSPISRLLSPLNW